MSDHKHTWEPDIGMGRYKCACGAAAKRNWRTGKMHPLKSQAKVRTVDFKPLGPRPQDEDNGVEPPRPMHSTRRYDPSAIGRELDAEIAEMEKRAEEREKMRERVRVEAQRSLVEVAGVQKGS